MVMECEERDHLQSVLRAATHELAWVLQEECRLLVEWQDAEAFAFVVENRIKDQRAALAAYRKHVAEHGCAQQSASS
jgi:hypothetical protein